MAIIAKESIISHLESTAEFPIALSEVWEWLGYSRKDSAVRGFLGCGMAESIDFTQSHEDVENSIKPVNEICMTIDCFKLWAMSAQTSKGKEVRLYYLKVEKEWKQLKIEASAQPVITQDHVEAYQFDRGTFVPWAMGNPTASMIFLGWKSLAHEPVQQLEQRPIDPAGVLPNSELIKLIDTLSLAANRAGLAGNKSIKESEFLDRQLDRLRVGFSAQSRRIEEQAEEIARLSRELDRKDKGSQNVDGIRLQKKIARLEKDLKFQTQQANDRTHQLYMISKKCPECSAVVSMRKHMEGEMAQSSQLTDG